MQWILESPGKKAKVRLSILALILILGIGTIDSLSGPEISLSVFYLAPILVVTYYIGFWGGIAASLISTFVYLMADKILAISYSRSAIPFWNAGVRLIFFLVTAYVFTKLRQAQKQLSKSEDSFRSLVEGAKT